MSNPEDPRVTSAMTLAEIMVSIGQLLQEKFDRDGSPVTDLETNTRAGAVWPNAVDDWLMALQANTDALKESVAGLEAADGMQIKDTRFTGATTTSSIGAGSTGNFIITFPTDRVLVWWLRVRSNSGESGPGGRIQLFADSSRTKTIYDSDLKMGDPAVDVDDFVDGMSWGAFADDGSGLELDGSDIPHMYGTITNGGSGASTFTVRVVASCA